MKNGRWVNTIYGRKFISNNQDFQKNAIIVIAGLFTLLILFILKIK